MNLVDAISKPNLNNTKININTKKAEPQVNLTQQADVVDLSTKKNANKAWTIGAIALGAVGILAGAYALIKKGQLPQEIKQMQKGADEMFDTYQTVLKNANNLANEAKEKAEKLKAEVMELFTNNGQRNGQQVADIVDSPNLAIMNETVADNAKQRCTLFINGNIQKIDEKVGDNVTTYLFDENGLLTMYKNAHSSNLAKNKLDFENGKLSSYAENIEDLADGTRKIEKWIDYTDGVPNYYDEASVVGEDIITVQKRLDFCDGKISNYSQDIVQNEVTEISSFAKNICFRENGTPSWYLKNTVCLSDGGTNAKLAVSIDENGKISNTIKNWTNEVTTETIDGE